MPSVRKWGASVVLSLLVSWGNGRGAAPTLAFGYEGRPRPEIDISRFGHVMTAEGLNGLRVLALESRRSEEIARLIRNHGGTPTIAPAMREVPLEANTEALDFAGGLIRGDYDLVVFLTGPGVQRLVEIAGLRFDRNVFLEALRRVKVASRGSKVNGILRHLGISVAVTAPEPCTWRELMSALDGVFGPSLAGMRAAVQEYGAPNFDLLRSLSERQVQWTRVPVYHWALPDDLKPLKDAIREIASCDIDVIVFLTRTQVTHLFQVAEQMGTADALRVGMKHALLLSIGPSTTEELKNHGIEPDFEPSHPKMGFLMNEAAGCAKRLLAEKRGRSRVI